MIQTKYARNKNHSDDPNQIWEQTLEYSGASPMMHYLDLPFSIISLAWQDPVFKQITVDISPIFEEPSKHTKDHTKTYNKEKQT